MSKSLNNLDKPVPVQAQTHKKTAKTDFFHSLFKFSNLPYSVRKHYSQYRNSSTKLQKKLVLNTTFENDERYDIVDVIGQGAYGIVVSAIDKRSSDKETCVVAIKKIEKAFQHKIFTKRTLRELKILRLLKHENVIGIHTLFLPKSREDFKDIYICSPLMDSDLTTVIKSSQPITDEHIQFFVYQILRGLKYIHSAGIIHRDLKPRNLLVNSSCDLKICDFGLSRTLHCGFDKPGKMTDYVATRWYRAPELLLEIGDYGPSLDVWSVGCILAELIRRRPFLPGTDTMNQLDITFQAFGTPTEEYMSMVSKLRLRKYLKSLKPRQPKDLDLWFPVDVNPLAIDLLSKLMTLDWRKRITVDEALKHPYLKSFHYPADEPVRDLVPVAEFEFEKYSLSLEQLKDLVYEEILLYHFEDFSKEYFRRISAGENPFKDVVNNANGKKYKDKDRTDENDE